MVTIKRNAHEREESNSSTFQVSYLTTKNDKQTKTICKKQISNLKA